MTVYQAKLVELKRLNVEAMNAREYLGYMIHGIKPDECDVEDHDHFIIELRALKGDIQSKDRRMFAFIDELHAMNGKLLKAYGDLTAYLKCCEGQSRGDGAPRKSSGKQDTLKPIARLIEAVENVRLN